MDVFASLGHMHKHGTYLELARDGSGEVLIDEPWDFDNQPTLPTKFHLAKADQVRLRCTHSNTTAAEVTYGESSEQEMCAAVLYYPPFDALDGCVIEPTAQ